MLTKVVARWRVLAVSTEIVYIVEYSIQNIFFLHFDTLTSMTIDRNGYLSDQSYLDIVLIICVWLNHT